MSVVNCVDKNYESKIHVHIPFVLLSQELYRQRTVVSMVFFLRFEQVFKYMHSALFCAFPGPRVRPKPLAGRAVSSVLKPPKTS